MGEIPRVPLLTCIGKKGRKMKPGETAVLLPTSSPRMVGLLAGICWTKSQNSRYSTGGGGGGGGAWLQMISAL